ncbi:UNVERIFIED_CONTAM: hypothetical protein GTU68_044591 [Idotea baltica]|nr:hypothetical protein [Idotea baltica]
MPPNRCAPRAPAWRIACSSLSTPTKMLVCGAGWAKKNDESFVVSVLLHAAPHDWQLPRLKQACSYRVRTNHVYTSTRLSQPGRSVFAVGALCAFYRCARAARRSLQLKPMRWSSALPIST